MGNPIPTFEDPTVSGEVWLRLQEWWTVEELLELELWINLDAALPGLGYGWCL